MDQVRHVYDGLAGPKKLKIFTDTGHLLFTKNHAKEWQDEVVWLLAQVLPSMAAQ